MTISDFLSRAGAERVVVTLSDGQVHTGAFRTDLLSTNALAAYFFGDIRPLSLPIDEIVACEAVSPHAVAV